MRNKGEWLLFVVLLVCLTTVRSFEEIKVSDIANFERKLACHEPFDPQNTLKPSCTPETCKRKIIDDIFSEDDIDILHSIAEKGMATRESVGGPTILDINTGYIRDSRGLDNLFMKSSAVYASDDFAHYGRIIHKLRQVVMDSFSLEKVYFTAPTFITRLDSSKNWKPQEIHDEYWHPHVDRNNTPSYHYSGLLYMSTHNEDFTGGRLLFVNAANYELFDDVNSHSPSDIEANTELVVEPKRGRVAIFSSGTENTHLVEPVGSGQRFVLSFWFTCDPTREFEIFLDGNAHVKFSKRFKENMLQRQAAAQKQQSKTKTATVKEL